jgi:SPP1 family predicted phage head-tail adaptor
MAIKIGDMRHLATIQAPTETVGATGEVTKTWEDISEVYITLDPLSATERYALDRISATGTHTIRMWANDSLRMNHRIKLDDRIFYITSIVEMDLLAIEIIVEEKES